MFLFIKICNFKFFIIFLGDKIDGTTNESVEGDKQDIRQDPFSLPAGFEWDTLDLGDEKQVQRRHIRIFMNKLISL